MLPPLVQIIMLKKYSAFIVKQLKQVLSYIRPLKSNLPKNLTLPNVSLIATERKFKIVGPGVKLQNYMVISISDVAEKFGSIQHFCLMEKNWLLHVLCWPIHKSGKSGCPTEKIWIIVPLATQIPNI